MPSSTLAPCLLLAAPPLADPNFRRSVILLANHTAEGALGWVLNGQGISDVATLLKNTGIVPEGLVLPDTEYYTAQAHIGGPVAPGSAWFIYKRTPECDHFEHMKLSDEWSGSADRALVRAIASNTGPSVFRLILGYAGWGPLQLDEEVRLGSWLPVPFDPGVVFGREPSTMWERAFTELVGVSPLAFAPTQGGVS